MESDEEYDWLGFIVNFIFAVIPAWIVIGIVVWKASPNMEGSKVFMITSISSIIIGIVAGIWRTGFWIGAAKLSPYSRKDRK